jgi:hypothetical protein
MMRRFAHVLIPGSVLPGVIGGVAGVHWDSIWTQFLSTWLSFIVRIVFGGDSGIIDLINDQTGFGGF